jgi:hypothetical protein
MEANESVGEEDAVAPEEGGIKLAKMWEGWAYA